MKIVITTPLEEQVPPAKYGGTELIVAHLANQYTALGHDVYLFASGDSHTDAHLVPIVPVSIRKMPEGRKEGSWRDYWKYTGVATIIEEINRISPDIIHNNYAWRLIAFENLLHYPMMSTMHGPMSDIKERETYTMHHNHPFISISDNQRLALPAINWIGTVYNGIDVTKFPFNNSRENRNYFIFLGRTSPEKGLAEIVQMVRKTNFKLKIAAKIDEVDRSYFAEKVKPYIDGRQIEFLGEVGLDEKGKLLSHAKALLLWLNWEEPFGLVVPESNICGTPVIVNRRGSMPELIRDGVNGFLVDSLEEMQAKMSEIGNIDPQNCSDLVHKRFSARIMAEQYLELAAKVIQAY